MLWLTTTFDNDHLDVTYGHLISHALCYLCSKTSLKSFKYSDQFSFTVTPYLKINNITCILEFTPKTLMAGLSNINLFSVRTVALSDPEPPIQLLSLMHIAAASTRRDLFCFIMSTFSSIFIMISSKPDRDTEVKTSTFCLLAQLITMQW